MYLYISGDLSARQRIRFEQHVDHCSECREALREYRQIIQAYQHVAQALTCSVTAEQVLRQARKPHGMRFQSFSLSPGTRIAVFALLMVILVGAALGTLWWRRAEKNVLQSERIQADIFTSASLTAHTPELDTSVFPIVFSWSSEPFDVLANEVNNLRRSGTSFSRELHSQGFQKTEIIKKKIEELRADDWFS